jgi:small basic protein (TIGR04137 family)
MSIDKSLISKSKLVRQRNVLTRPERIKHLMDEGLWDEKKSVYGLPKVKIMKIKKKAKVKKAAEETDAAGDKEKTS